MTFLFRYVYKWFLLIYKVSYFVGILGYIIMMATFLGLHFFFGVKPHIWLDAGLLLMFYALYYGVMARDMAEIITEKMVSQIGVSWSTFKFVFWLLQGVLYWNGFFWRAPVTKPLDNRHIDLQGTFLYLCLLLMYMRSPID